MNRRAFRKVAVRRAPKAKRPTWRPYVTDDVVPEDRESLRDEMRRWSYDGRSSDEGDAWLDRLVERSIGR